MHFGRLVEMTGVADSRLGGAQPLPQPAERGPSAPSCTGLGPARRAVSSRAASCGKVMGTGDLAPGFGLQSFVAPQAPPRPRHEVANRGQPGRRRLEVAVGGAALAVGSASSGSTRAGDSGPRWSKKCKAPISGVRATAPGNHGHPGPISGIRARTGVAHSAHLY